MLIVCFFIECKDQEKLEQLLKDNQYAFYDATDSLAWDGYKYNDFTTLEEVEAFMELK